jgi:hypothetical protein
MSAPFASHGGAPAARRKTLLDSALPLTKTGVIPAVTLPGHLKLFCTVPRGANRPCAPSPTGGATTIGRFCALTAPDGMPSFDELFALSLLAFCGSVVLLNFQFLEKEKYPFASRTNLNIRCNMNERQKGK